ncbi:MAG: hypothetical protein NTU88_13930 [Armatimonadetes bacterium]|nr:hypothetical protein [Armatimonadota bacterium]
MKRRARKTVIAVFAILAITLIASQVAHLQTQFPIARCPIQVTPQAVILGEATSGTMKTATVVVTNVSREDVHVTVQPHKDWLRATPTGLDLAPGRSGRINLIGTLDSLRPRVEFAEPPIPLPGKSPRPVADADVMWVCGGQVCTPVAVFAVKMTPQQ